MMPKLRYKIHPAIGIARVGNADRSDASDDFFFIGPEHPDVSASGKDGKFKTDAGKVRAQAARFYVWEYEMRKDRKFYPIREVNTSDQKVDITWKVHLANRKASFGEFSGQDGASDKPFYVSYVNVVKNDTENTVRNAKIKPLSARRKQLDLDPGEKSIGARENKVEHFNVDKLKIKTLGELRVDHFGRLIVIGGMGVSDNDPALGDAALGDFANNDGWFDDVSDGPVSVALTIDGKKISDADIDNAWVFVGPPDFAPAVRSYRTLFDTMIDVLVTTERVKIPEDDGLFAGSLAYIADMRRDWTKNKTIKDFKPSFARDIAPILNSLTGVWRVHQNETNPTTTYHDTTSASKFDKPGDANNLMLRKIIVARLRDPATLDSDDVKKIDPTKMPSAFGDRNDRSDANDEPTHPAFFHSVSKLQYALLQAWEKDNCDYAPAAPVDPKEIRPDLLDRAALQNMSGGAFYPGMETGWLFARPEVWKSAFRLARGRTVGSIPIPDEKKDKRDKLVVEAGAFTQQMAVPWQADFHDCSVGTVTDPRVGGGKRRIAWWPATRPDEVFPESDPNRRQEWARYLDGTTFPKFDPDPKIVDPNDRVAQLGRKAMVENWSSLGFVVETTIGGVKDLYEVEFTGSSPLEPLVASLNKPTPVAENINATKVTSATPKST